jgi:hypothetical protein
MIWSLFSTFFLLIYSFVALILTCLLDFYFTFFPLKGKNAVHAEISAKIAVFKLKKRLFVLCISQYLMVKINQKLNSAIFV